MPEFWIVLFILSSLLNLYLLTLHTTSTKKQKKEQATFFHIKGDVEMMNYIGMFQRLNETKQDVVIRMNDDKVEFFSVPRDDEKK